MGACGEGLARVDDEFFGGKADEAGDIGIACAHSGLSDDVVDDWIWD